MLREVCILSKNLEVSNLLDFYGGLLTDKQRETVEYYYNDDLSLGEIAENLGISRQGVRDSIKRAETVMIDMEEKLGLVKKTRELRRSLDTIRHNIDIIDERNMKVYRSNAINESIKVILKELDRLSNE
ncbi:MAG: YlxM family DNA-binding protein [Clostridia bacterium]|nr:YlxM family DNA-binding protein [Clostridia bacterium]